MTSSDRAAGVMPAGGVREFVCVCVARVGVWRCVVGRGCAAKLWTGVCLGERVLLSTGPRGRGRLFRLG